MRYNLSIMAMPQEEEIENTDFDAPNDFEAAVYAISQANFNDAQSYDLVLSAYHSDFEMCVWGTRGCKLDYEI